MIAWAQIILALLKIVDLIMGRVNQDQWIKAGVDSEVAKTALAIAGKTKAGKAIMEKVDAMSDAEVDDGLRGLEPRIP